MLDSCPKLDAMQQLTKFASPIDLIAKTKCDTLPAVTKLIDRFNGLLPKNVDLEAVVAKCPSLVKIELNCKYCETKTYQHAERVNVERSHYRHMIQISAMTLTSVKYLNALKTSASTLDGTISYQSVSYGIYIACVV